MNYQNTTKDADSNCITTQVDVPYYPKRDIKAFQGYISYINNIGKPINNDWLTITETDIDNYIFSNNW